MEKKFFVSAWKTSLIFLFISSLKSTKNMPEISKKDGNMAAWKSFNILYYLEIKIQLILVSDNM